MPPERAAEYPRPPRLEPDARRVRVVHGGMTVVDTVRAQRVLETWSPPTFYVPMADLSPQVELVRSAGSSVCEWKGRATYWSLAVDGTVVAPDAAWSYESPTPAFAPIVDHVAFYASRVDECWVDDIRVVPEASSYLGGWIVT